MSDKLQKVLEYCLEEKKYADNPASYQDEQYYIQCRAKSDVLGDIIEVIKKELK